ncbi:autotransporter domain-containing protein, partial [Parapedobacter pyrenivorans]|uniref:autotransporter family protein n=1 Tax=Parapedobacter pyrenivorans TaxID=1305674 RepID=UPI00333ECDEA
LNKIGKGELVLSGALNTYTGWTNIGEGSVRVTQENSLMSSKGVDLTGTNTTLILEADQTLYGLRGYETDATKRANPASWTRVVDLGDNTLTLDLQNFKTGSGDDANLTYFYGNITGTGTLIKQGTAGSTFASGFDGFTGGIQILTGGIQTLSDTTISTLSGRAGTFLDILDTTLTLDMDRDQVYDGLVYSSATWRSYDNRPEIVKRGVGNFTSSFHEVASGSNPERGYYGDLTLEKGNIISKSDYIMADGSVLTFHVNPDANGAVNPITLDVRDYIADFSGARDGEGNDLDTSQRNGITLLVTLGESTTGWNMVSGSTIVAQVLGNGNSDYSGITVAETDSIFHSIYTDLQANTDRNRYDMYVRLGVNGFAGVGDTYNTIEVGENLDRIRLLDLSNSGLQSLLQDMWAAGTNLEGEQMRNQRIALLRNLYQQLSGDTIANGMYMGLNKPWENAFSRLNLDSQMVYIDPPQAGGNRRIANMRNLWFTPTVQSLTARSDGNARRFGIDRPGYQIGFDKRVAMNTSIGFMLGYDTPKLHQGTDRITASNFQVGVYGGAMVGNYWEVKGFMGFGHQNFKSQRTVYYPDDPVVPDGHGGYRPIGGSQRTQTAHGKYDGDTFNFSLELSRPLFLGVVILRPTIGLDSEHAFRYAFSETGDAIAMKFKRSSLSRTRARFGLSAETTTLDRAIFTGRLGYSCLLGGHDYATAQGQFIGIAADPQTVRSVAVGKSYFEAGVGTRIFLNPTKTLSLVGQYDASVADHWAEHRALVGLGLYY